MCDFVALCLDVGRGSLYSTVAALPRTATSVLGHTVQRHLRCCRCFGSSSGDIVADQRNLMGSGCGGCGRPDDAKRCHAPGSVYGRGLGVGVWRSGYSGVVGTDDWRVRVQRVRRFRAVWPVLLRGPFGLQHRIVTDQPSSGPTTTSGAAMHRHYSVNYDGFYSNLGASAGYTFKIERTVQHDESRR